MSIPIHPSALIRVNPRHNFFRDIAATLALLLAIAAAGPLLAKPLKRPEHPRVPKYSPLATRLYDAREYLQKEPAPDYWALAPYYLSQLTDASCSIAASATLINGLRADRKLDSTQSLVTHDGLRELADRLRVGPRSWKDATASGSVGVTLDQLAELLKGVLPKFDIKATIEVTHVAKAGEQELASLRKVLADNEKSDRDFLLINFRQSEFTGDPEGAVGHMALVAAYDAKADRVLILDPDRSYYEPYWVSSETLLKGLATPDDETGQPRGYLRITTERFAAGDR